MRPKIDKVMKKELKQKSNFAKKKRSGDEVRGVSTEAGAVKDRGSTGNGL